MKTVDILAFGEPLMEFAEVERGPERLYLPGYGGDVSNAAIAAARQGARCAIFTALGDDAFGREFLKLWDEEGVERSCVLIREGGRTGVYFISYGPEGHVFSYARAGSAASLVTEKSFPGRGSRRRACSMSPAFRKPSRRNAPMRSLPRSGLPGINGTAVSYDTNLRLRLWPLDRARAVIHGAVALSDIARPGLDDARQLTGLDRPEDICAFYLGLGCRIVALTLGKSGTMVATAERREVIPARPVEAVDATGAGDMFDGAFLADWLVHGDPFRAAAYANAAAALSTLGHGAVAPMPRRPAVEAFLKEA